MKMYSRGHKKTLEIGVKDNERYIKMQKVK